MSLLFFIYVGKDYTADGSPLAVVRDLVSKAGLTGVLGVCSATSTYAMIVGKRGMTNMRVCVKSN